MNIIIKTLQGYSGSKVLLMQRQEQIFVRKIGNISRNLERLNALREVDINIPNIISANDEYYDMEYIPHQDMISWLLHNQIDQFTDWMLDCIEKLKQNSINKDWSDIYKCRLSIPNLTPFWSQLNFTADKLIVKLPKILPYSHYHGDLTMDNCIYGANGKFYLIDPITTEYESWVFDLAKLMQDLESGWFIRNKNVMIQGKLWSIKSILFETYPEIDNNNLLILMLLRILPYAKNQKDQQFIIREVNKLWI